jgi:Tfp pilus assembly protein PilF
VDAAITKYQRIWEQDPNNLRIAMRIASLFVEKDEHMKAREIYEEILTKEPNSRAAANNLAYLYAEHFTSETTLQKALDLAEQGAQQGDPLALDTLGWVHFRRGDLDQAMAAFSKALTRSPDHPIVTYHMGMVHIARGEREKAREMLQRALQSGTEFPGKEKAQEALEQLG